MNETLTISNVVAVLATLGNPQHLWRIRVLTGNVSFLDLDAPSRLEAWGQLDEVLCGLCPKPQKEESGAGLTFQVASRKTIVPLVQGGWLVRLLPKFSRVGSCEAVEV